MGFVTLNISTENGHPDGAADASIIGCSVVQKRCARHTRGMRLRSMCTPRRAIETVAHIGVSRSTNLGRGSDRMPSMMTNGMKPMWKARAR